ncbi:uncharacterized protein LOC107044142 [Diachasma alloeum]|uniref:uncharacterized protein LOC107044142 n=1 Tax=Diachasma alloeum TaxID=454923 RepID=UPI0007384FF1|nr:uncharacterized protein LOC107044142 [Diachasma alloeum]
MTQAYSFVYVCLVLTVAWIIGSASGKPIQVLKNIPGFIPVYIRHGNEPLEEINPSLAEAFHEEKNNMNVIPIEEQHVSKLDGRIPKNIIPPIPHIGLNKEKREILYSTFQE